MRIPSEVGREVLGKTRVAYWRYIPDESRATAASTGSDQGKATSCGLGASGAEQIKRALDELDAGETAKEMVRQKVRTVLKHDGVADSGTATSLVSPYGKTPTGDAVSEPVFSGF